MKSKDTFNLANIYRTINENTNSVAPIDDEIHNSKPALDLKTLSALKQELDAKASKDEEEMSGQTEQVIKQIKMLTNNALKNVFAAIETLEGLDSIPYSGEVDALTVNLDEEVGRLMDILDEKMPKQRPTENEETPEEGQERVRRKWELNKQRWDKWKAENPEKARLNAQRKAGLYGKKEEHST